MRYAPVAMALAALFICSTAFAGLNPNATFVLHARLGAGGSCTDPALPTCQPGSRPVTNVPANTPLMRVYLFLNNVTSVAGVQTAFAWPGGWLIDPNELGVTWLNCQSNQINGTTPQNPGGPNQGTIGTAFDCVTASFLPVGRMDFSVGASGCLEQVESSFPFANHVVDCAQGQDTFPYAVPANILRFGSICAGSNGRDSCDPPSAVEPSSWGRIKATYN